MFLYRSGMVVRSVIWARVIAMVVCGLWCAFVLILVLFDTQVAGLLSHLFLPLLGLGSWFLWQSIVLHALAINYRDLRYDRKLDALARVMV